MYLMATQTSSHYFFIDFFQVIVYYNNVKCAVHNFRSKRGD